METIHHRVAQPAKTAGGATALLAPGRAPLDYAGLLAGMERTAGALTARGIGRNDRIAAVLPAGPDLAAAFLGVSGAATFAPLNPGYPASEFEFYLTDLSAKALLLAAGSDGPARDVAASLDVPVIEMAPGPAAGAFDLPLPDGPFEPPSPDDIALVLHTSGTTSRPKIVPLSHANLCASATNVARALALTPDDRCLNVMPLFHIHGLVAGLLAPLSAGSSIVCPPGFMAPEFFPWLDEFRPTWYTAVPTMHQAILARAAEHADVRERVRLRFLRSSSSSLPPPVMAELMKAFETPVIEAYGMTEAAHQMTCNPLPPGKQLPGSVGLPAGPEVEIMDEAGAVLPTDATGEIVIRGPNVFAGYESNPAANAEAFTDGWFRTGDLGRIDGDGYLTIDGRLKEIINRGGEKISPREVDEALLEHADVAQAVAFAVADERLGEAVYAAVIRRPGADVSEEELKAWVGDRLAFFKVPERVIFLAEIPKGPTGKLRRIGLADVLGVTAREPAAAEHVDPRNEVEEFIAGVFAEVLKTDRIGVLDRFLDRGGDSFLAGRIVTRIREATGAELTLAQFFSAETVAGLATILSGDASR